MIAIDNVLGVLMVFSCGAFLPTCASHIECGREECRKECGERSLLKRRMRLCAGGTPAGACAVRLLGGRSLDLGSGAHSAEHDSACQDGRLAAIIVRHLLLRLVDEDAGLPRTLPTREPGLGLLLRRRRGAAMRRGRQGGAGLVGGGGADGGERESRAGAGGARARVHGTKGVGRRCRRAGWCGDRRELLQHGSQPRRLAHLVRDHREDLLVLVLVGLQQLLREAHALRQRRLQCSGREFLRPDGQELADLARVPVAETNGDAAGVDEEVELDAAKSGDPLRPLNVRGLASVVDGARRERAGGERQAAASRTAKRLGGNPRRRELRSQVRLEGKLQLDDSRGRVLLNEGAREVGDGIVKSDRQGTERRDGGRGGHCNERYNWTEKGGRAGMLSWTGRLGRDRPAIECGSRLAEVARTGMRGCECVAVCDGRAGCRERRMQQDNKESNKRLVWD